MSTLTLAAALSLSVVQCPAYIYDVQSLHTPVSGWETAIGNSEKRLLSANVFVGHPRSRESIQPMKGKQRSWVWSDLPDNAWLECRYIASAISLYRPLNGNRSCVFMDAPAGSIDPPSMKCTSKRSP